MPVMERRDQYDPERLDPEETLAQLKAEEEIKHLSALINLLNGLPAASKSASAAPSANIFKFEEPMSPSLPEIPLEYKGYKIFEPENACCLFDANNLDMKNFKAAEKGYFPRDKNFWKIVARLNVLSALPDTGTIHICLYVFYIAAVHESERVVEYCRRQLPIMRPDWSPSIDSILTVFINWGIRPEFLSLDDVQLDINLPPGFEMKPNGRERKFHMEPLLNIINTTAEGIAENTEDSKLNKLLQVLIHSALHQGQMQTDFLKCVHRLFACIPDDRWNYEQVKTLAHLLHQTRPNDNFGSAYISYRLLPQHPRSRDVARVLACLTLDHILATETNMSPLASCTDVEEIISYYGPLYKMKYHILYIVFRLVDVCVKVDYDTNSLSLDTLNFLVLWLRNYGENIPLNLQSEDFARLQEFINRCLTITWARYIQELTDVKIRSLCNGSFSSTGEKEEVLS